MKKQQKIWVEEHRVSWDDTAPDNKLKWGALNRMLQQAAVNHAEHLGFGFTDISKENVSWVLFRLHIQIKRLPGWKEKIKVVTWPSQVKTLSAFREFEMLTEKNEVLCNASSEWLIIDLDSRKPRRVEEFHKFDDLMTRRTTITEPLPRYNGKGEFKTLFENEVRYSHLDMNGHMNALYYFDWFADAYYKVFNRQEAGFLQMTYFNECMAGDQVIIQQSVNDPTVFRGVKKKDDKVTFLSKATG